MRKWGKLGLGPVTASILALLLLVSACTSAAPSARPSPNPETPPRADLLQIASELRHSPTPITPLPPSMTDYPVGHVATFTVVSFTFRRISTVTAELKAVTPNAYFYVEQGIVVPQGAVNSSAAEFESNIVPAVRRYINPSWEPGSGIDSRVSILNTQVAGVAGYISSLDLVPKSVYAFSNERPVAYMSLLTSTPGTPVYYQTLAHEMQHLAQEQANPQQQAWMQEGSSELFSGLAGYRPGLFQSFLADPNVDLVHWDTPDSRIAAHYGAAHLFLDYLGGQVGFDKLPLLIGDSATGMNSVRDVLKSVGDPRTPEEVVRDWTIANALAGTIQPSSQLRYSYPSPTPGAVSISSEGTNDGAHIGTVSQYAAAYATFAASPNARTISFNASPAVPLLPTGSPDGQQFWWSGRGDGIASTLTRSFDLTRVQKATLRFKLWYDIEDQYDFGYVLASRDGGKTWNILQGNHTTDKNDLGQSFGAAYTGTSGTPVTWEDETVDLAAYTGGTVLVRFLYLTDQGVSNTGMALDAVSIPEIGFHDAAGKNEGWAEGGFQATGNATLEKFFLSLIYKDTGEVALVPVDANNHGVVAVAPGRAAVFVVTAVAPQSSQPATFRYTVRSTH